MQLILYSKPGCHLCEALEAKLRQLNEANSGLAFDLEIRDITRNADWFERYQYEVPVLCRYEATTGTEAALPRFSPRASTATVGSQLKQWLT
ncbi:glutaredoxin family protein [Leptolyngbya sp. FACHB-261]|uniref:glutaredoxin family protein n=1 Tax=Leptolyngbya sp. FACHB-261 TaxID=2692806 RepID=UPI0016867468|nr:glutaredoxin family protein [Leptolyngbya sp. FACHB-261]MBD2104073.1 glutaredoxin family protein [Leptolyngbya sp. FACHB-261]